MVTTLMPAGLPRLRKISKEPSVPLFPNLPKDEAWKELPDPIKEGGVERLISLFCNGVNNAFSLRICFAHNNGYLIPELGCVGTRVQEVIHSLFCAFT